MVRGQQSVVHGAEQEASCTQASYVPCQLSPWPPARAGFSPPSQVIVHCGLEASSFQIINVIIISLWADFYPVSSVTYGKDK